MKKILLVVMVAVAFMACKNNGGNGGTVPAKDKKAYAAVTTEAYNLFGKDAATVDKALVDAGYVNLKEAAQMPRRIQMPAVKAGANDLKEVYYAYGVPENYATMTKEEANKWTADLFKKGGGFIIAVVVFTPEGECLAFHNEAYYGVSTDASSLYFVTADELYSQLPDKDKALQAEWAGFISPEEHSSDQIEYEDRAKYITDLKAKVDEGNGVSADEMAVYITSMQYDGMFYSASIIVPTKAEVEQLEKEGGASFSVFGGVVGVPAIMIYEMTN